jgi:hypothetical protein
MLRISLSALPTPLDAALGFDTAGTLCAIFSKFPKFEPFPKPVSFGKGSFYKKL